MQLTDAYDPQNIFAKILRDEMPSIRVFEDETTVAFMDICRKHRAMCWLFRASRPPMFSPFRQMTRAR